MASSIFIVGLVKSGSTLLNRVMRPIAEAAGFDFVAPANALRQQGVDLRDASPTFEPEGHAYGGFRNLPWPLPFAAGRTVFLARDPRDALTSLYFSVAYSHAPPGAAASNAMLRRFETRRARALAQSIDDFVLAEAAHHGEIVLETLGNLPEGSRRHAYEAVIFDKLAWARDMADFLALDVAERRIAAIVDRQDIHPAEEAPRAHVRHVTPGDHRDKLAPETIRQLDEILAPAMTALGYAGER